MSDTRFRSGTSGNPKGRPLKPRRPNISAFEIVLDKRLAARIGGRERELTIEEGLQQQTLKDAIAGKSMAIRKVLKMIEKREEALTNKNTSLPKTAIPLQVHTSSDNANEAMRILDIVVPDTSHPNRWRLNAWATQAALSRPGRRKFSRKEVEQITFFTIDADSLHWPRGKTA